jgi:hypothetical protein
VIVRGGVELGELLQNVCQLSFYGNVSVGAMRADLLRWKSLEHMQAELNCVIAMVTIGAPTQASVMR